MYIFRDNFIHIYIYIYIYIYGGGLKSSYNNVIFTADDFFDQWDPSTATLMEEVCRLQGRLC